MESAPRPFYDWHKLTLQLTNVCDLECRMCPVIIGKKYKLSRDQAFHVADFAKRRGFREIELGGGEPTLLNYFWDLLDELCDSPMRVTVLTNAVRLTDEHIARYSRWPNVVAQVSIDGVGEVHDGIRLQVSKKVDSVFDATERNIRKLAEAGVKLALNTVVQKSNWNNMLDVYERFKDVPYLYHGFSLVEDHPDNEENISAAELEHCIDTLREIQRRASIDGEPAALTNELLSNYRLGLKYPGFKMHPGRGCTVVKRGVAVTHDGYVHPCWHYPWNSDRIDRSIHHRTLDEIVDDPEVQAEIGRAVGPRGCEGCSTMCYNWDPDFQRKVMQSNGALKLRRAYQQAVILNMKDYLRRNHPSIFAAAKSVKNTLRTPASN